MYKHFQEEILARIDSENYPTSYRKATEMLLYYILKAPNVKIYEQ